MNLSHLNQEKLLKRLIFLSKEEILRKVILILMKISIGMVHLTKINMDKVLSIYHSFLNIKESLINTAISIT